MATVKVTASDFQTQVLGNSLPVFVDFYAEWCGPCRMAEPVLEELSETYNGKVVIAKVNVDENQELAARYDVMSIPTTIIFKGGAELGRQTGFSGKETFEELIKRAI